MHITASFTHKLLASLHTCYNELDEKDYTQDYDIPDFILEMCDYFLDEKLCNFNEVEQGHITSNLYILNSYATRAYNTICTSLEPEYNLMNQACKSNLALWLCDFSEGDRQDILNRLIAGEDFPEDHNHLMDALDLLSIRLSPAMAAMALYNAKVISEYNHEDKVDFTQFFDFKPDGYAPVQHLSTDSYPASSQMQPPTSR